MHLTDGVPQRFRVRIRFGRKILAVNAWKFARIDCPLGERGGIFVRSVSCSMFSKRMTRGRFRDNQESAVRCHNPLFNLSRVE